MTTFAQALAAGRVTTDEALALYDDLGAVPTGFMIGTWAGAEFPTGHRMDGMLTATGWYGKRFTDAETVHPLLFHTADRRAAFPVDPAFAPVGLPLPANRSYHRLITAMRPVIGTRRPTARLRMTEYRGVVSATMIYDAKPILDVFRRVDDTTVLGAMDLRGAEPYFFVLRRDDGFHVLA
ncbi:MAG: DUF4334 domain-containing protein [Pseudonocardia sp.]